MRHALLICMHTPGSAQSGPFLKSYHKSFYNKLVSLHGLVYTRTTARSRPQDSEICRNYELHDDTCKFCMLQHIGGTCINKYGRYHVSLIYWRNSITRYITAVDTASTRLPIVATCQQAHGGWRHGVTARFKLCATPIICMALILATHCTLV